MIDRADGPARSPRGGGGNPAAGNRSGTPGLLTRTAWVFVSPGRLFARLREQPTWLGALLLVAAAGVAASAMVPDQLLLDAMQQQAAAPDSPAGAPPPEDMVVWMRAFGFAASAIGPFILAAILAGLLLFVYNLVLGGEGTYRQALSVSSHTLLITAAGTLVNVPLARASGNLNTSLSLHLLAPALERGAYLYHLLHGLNAFGLWAAVVLGIGASRLYPDRSAGGSVALFVGLYVAFKAIVAIFGGMF